MSSRDILCDAVQQMRVVSFTYDDRHREVHPLIVLENKEGEPVLHCWQVSGDTVSGRPVPCWGNFEIRGMANLSVTPHSFSATPSGYDPDRFENIVCKVPKTR